MKIRLAVLLSAALLTTIAAHAQKPFACGDELQPGVPYATLAECYQQERAEVTRMTSYAFHTYEKLRQVQADLDTLSTAYDDLRRKFSQVETVQSASAPPSAHGRFTTPPDRNAVPGPLIEPAVPLYYPVMPSFNPPLRFHCNTVYGSTSCYEQ